MIGTDLIVENLLQAQREVDAFVRNAGDAGIDIDFGIDLWGFAMDLLEVPVENHPEEGEAWVMGVHFCRDWLYDAFRECEDVKSYISWVHQEIAP